MARTRSELSVVLFSAFVAVACGSERVESRGTLAKLGEDIKVLDAAEEIEVCSIQHCEPNYIYGVSFGRKRRSSPPPAPAPIPLPRGERVDYALKNLRVREAWNFTQGENVVVAVIDSGVDGSHPDLAENLWINRAEANGLPGIDDDRNGYIDDVHGWDFVNHRPNGRDDHGHGTHVAGTIAASANGLGMVGVAPKVKIMALKFLASNGYGDSRAAIEAIHYAVNNGAHVISNSWGGGGRSQFLDDAIQSAHARGILVTAAAGNSAMDNDRYPVFPAGYNGVISVASTDERDAISEFSNYGAGSVMVAAPGSNIYSTLLGGGYGYMSGTSMATPHVSGALALARSLDRGASRQRISDLLCGTARSMRRVACGFVDVYGLVNAVR